MQCIRNKSYRNGWSWLLLSTLASSFQLKQANRRIMTYLVGGLLVSGLPLGLLPILRLLFDLFLLPELASRLPARSFAVSVSITVPITVAPISRPAARTRPASGPSSPLPVSERLRPAAALGTRRGRSVSRRRPETSRRWNKLLLVSPSEALKRLLLMSV